MKDAIKSINIYFFHLNVINCVLGFILYGAVFLLYFSSSCIPYVASFTDYPFIIVPSVFSNVYVLYTIILG